MSIKQIFSRLFSGEKHSQLRPVSTQENGEALLSRVDALNEIKFTARAGAAFDSPSGLVIPMPRIQPHTLANGGRATEYQFAFYRDERVVGRLGLWGPDTLVDAATRREWMFTLDLSHEWLISSIVALKRTIGFESDDLAFVRGVAHGMVIAYAGQPDRDEHMRYRAITTSTALKAAGISIPRDLPVSALGTSVLADVLIQATPKKVHAA